MSDLAKEANAVTGKEYDGTSAGNLTKAFEQIYNTITTTAKIKSVFHSPTPCLNGLIRSISPMWQTAPISRNM